MIIINNDHNCNTFKILSVCRCSSINHNLPVILFVTFYFFQSSYLLRFIFQASSPRIKRRVVKSLKDVAEMVEQDNREGFLRKKVGFAFRGNLSERLSRASIVGTKMIPKVIFPAAPKLFRDAWVLAELLLTIIQFVYAFFSTNYRINQLYNIIYISLSSVNLVLALIDSFYYFYQLGSCMVLFHLCKRRMKKKRRSDYECLDNPTSGSTPEIDDEDMESISNMQLSCLRFCRLSPKRKEQLNMWFELIRNILSEALIYPLVVLDLFGVISDPTISDKLNFSFFLIGSFYLVLSVYIARVMMSILTLLTMKNLLSSTKSGKHNVIFIVRFLFHSIGQVIVHLCCVLAVGVKIKQENDHNNGQYHASPILWIVIFGGWFIPFLGLITYFAINYFWAQQFSIGFFIELISLLQEGNVAESLMQSKDSMKAEAEERAQNILEKMEYKQVKSEYKELESTGQFKKLSYPLKLPLFITFCIVYNCILAGFFASLLFTSKHGHIVPVQINDYKGISLLVIIIIISLANIHLIMISSITIIVFLGVFVTLVFLPGILSIPIFVVLFVVVRKLYKAGKM